MPVATDSVVLLSGPLLLGCMFNWALFGTSVVQQYDYFDAYRNTDRLLIRFSVYFILVLEIVDLIFTTNNVWVILVLGWGKPTSSQPLPWTSTARPLLTSTVANLVRPYFVWRIRSLKRTTITDASCALIVTTASLELGASITIVAQDIWVPFTAKRFSAYKPMYAAFFAGGFASDLIIAANMGYMLWKPRNSLRTNIFRSMAVYIVETGIIIVLAHVVQLILSLAWYQIGFLHIALRFVKSRLYPNVLLAVLNMRPAPMSESEHIDGSRSMPMHRLEGLSMGTDGLAVTTQAERSEPHANSLASNSATTVHKISSQDVSSTEDLADPQKAPEI